MRRFLLGFVAALALAIPAALIAAPGDQNVKGNLNVQGSANIAGDTFTRSVQATGSSVISNFGAAFAEDMRASKYTVASGGSGYLWADGAGAVTTRIMAVSGIGQPMLNVPAPVLVIEYTTTSGALWFEPSAGAWTCISGCSP